MPAVQSVPQSSPPARAVQPVVTPSPKVGVPLRSSAIEPDVSNAITMRGAT